MIMSEARGWIAGLAQSVQREAGAFRADPRFDDAPIAPEPPEEAQEDEPSPDPLALAYARGFAAGVAEAEARAREQARIQEEAREKLALSFARLDKACEEELRQRLRDTVAALCESAIAPMALDEAMLLRRIEKCVSMLARADDERIIRLNPEDLTLIAPRLAAEWRVVPDPSLERGALRVETRTGGVEDGPALWRQAIAEALSQC
ncbi:MAG: flagellar assembly protein FliH [Novosphingobium sp.]|nr:flagellar assembly protein FliH [Novosphingobium sp.]